MTQARTKNRPGQLTGRSGGRNDRLADESDDGASGIGNRGRPLRSIK